LAKAPARWRWIALPLGALSVSLAGLLPATSGLNGMSEGAGASLSSPSTPATALCGVASPDGSGSGAFETPAAYTSTPASATPATVYVSSQVEGFYYDPADGDVYAKTPSSVAVSSASGAPLEVLPVPTASTAGAALSEGNAPGSLIVGPSGGVYFFMFRADPGFGFDLVKLSATGTQEWDLTVPGTPNGLYAWHDTNGNWAVAVVVRGASSSELITPAGTVAAGTGPVPGTGSGESVSPAPGGGLTYNDGSYVHELGLDGAPVTPSQTGVPEFGDANPPASPSTPGAPLTVGSGGAVEVGSTLYAAGQGGVELFTPTGIYEGAAQLSGFSPASSLDYDAGAQGLLYQASGGVYLVTLSQLQALVSSPAPPTQDGFGDALGAGAGIVTNATAGYFPPGATPSVEATFDPWWASYPEPLELSYWVANGDKVTSEDLPAPTVVPLSWSLVPSGSPLHIPLQAPAAPGVYLVNADLIDASDSVTIGSTCLTYSVGMVGDTLDFSTLAPGESYGGPSPLRGVELASTLGTGDMREQLSMATLLPNCNSWAPTGASCGPAALTGWGAYDPATEQAAAEAQALGVDFEVQVGQDNAVDEALVGSGLWGQDVEAIMEHFATSAPDLHYVEAWNEPNAGPFSPSSYVSSVLEPFYDGVQAADASDGRHLEVIGGTVVGMDVYGWWAGIAQAGGLSYMDIAGIHPYPGYDRSFEEEGTPQAIEDLRSLLASYGKASMPVWDTEQGWWSDGEQAFYDVGNWAPREWMWLKALGVSSWDYFITEGQFSGFGTDFSLIDAANGDYFVKPGAIGLMTVSNLLGDRPFLKIVDIGIPHGYGMLFGPPENGSASNDVLAVWTDDLDVAGEVSLSSGGGTVIVPTTSSLGAPGSLTVPASSPAPIELSGAPLYLTVPEGADIAVGPAESFGPNLALASAGATATASSSQGGTNVPADVVRGSADAGNGGGISSTPAWASVTGDTSPWVQVNLPAPATIDRVVVSTSSVGSVLPGLRDYSISLDESGSWVTVAGVADEFFDRMELLSFAPVSGVSAIKVVPTALDFNSQLGGLPPYYWSAGYPDYAVVYSVEAYGPPSDPVTTSTAPAATTTSMTSPVLTATSGTVPGGTSPPLTATSGTGLTTTTSLALTTTSSARTTTTTAPATTSTSAPDPKSVPHPPALPAPAVTAPTVPRDLGTPPDPRPTTGAGTRVPAASPARATPTTARKGTPPPGRTAARTGSTWSRLSFPHKVRPGSVLPVRVRLTGKRGVPSGEVSVVLAGRALCRARLKLGEAVCDAVLPSQNRTTLPYQNRATRQAAAGRGRSVGLTVVYAGDRAYAGSSRHVVVTIILSGPARANVVVAGHPC
jgi:hypothetical protein